MATLLSAQPYLGATPDPAAATREAMDAAHLGAIPLVEIFYSLQGEGLRTGQPTVFVRTAGCNCDCWFCDTDFRVREVLKLDDVLARIADVGGDCRWVCLTGGEPTILDLQPLCDALHERGYAIQVETNGGRPRPDWRLDHITVSPKERQGQKMAAWHYDNATEFKHVVDDPADLEYALTQSRLHDKPTFLQPNAVNPASIALCIDAVKARPARLRLSLQTHKMLDIR